MVGGRRGSGVGRRLRRLGVRGVASAGGGVAVVRVGVRGAEGAERRAPGGGARASTRLTWRVRVSGRCQLRDWGAAGRAGPSGPRRRRRRYKAGDGEHVMSECGGRGGGSSSSDDAEDEGSAGGGGGTGPAGSGSLSPAPAGTSSASRLRRGLRGASLMARRRPELLCGAVALGCAVLLALKFTCR